MADHREVIVERLYVKVPGTDKLRKNAGARLRHMLANGWREIGRSQNADHVAVTLERTGVPPLKTRLPRAAPAIQFRERRPRGQGGGGPRGRR
jgi:hypothetical protein